jgi:hypothetical protein
VAANAERRKHFESDLPDVLDRLEHVQSRVIRDMARAVLQTAVAAQERFTRMADEQPVLAETASAVDPHRDVKLWVETLTEPDTATPPDLPLVPNVSGGGEGGAWADKI